MTSDNFKLVDLTEYNAINIAEYPLLTNVVLNATDATPLANASVKLISVSDTYTTTTDSNGSFTFSNTPIRSYTIEVSAEGFVTYSTSFDAESTSSISLSPETVGADSNDFRFVLTWNETPADMDFFFFIHDADGNLLDTINYNDKSYIDGDFEVTLDNDEVNGYGPETITVTNLPENYTLKVFIYNYSRDENITNSNSNVTIYQGNSSLAEYNVSGVSNPQDSTHSWWSVATYHNSTLTPDQTLTTGPYY